MSIPPPSIENATTRISSGVKGLDDILFGGLTPGQLYLIEGDPGSGKTTIALQFLLEGVRCGERCLFVTLSETGRELALSAKSHGWSLDGIEIFELISPEELLDSESAYTMYHPSEIEFNKATASIVGEVERRRPARIVIDSLSELQLLAQDPLRYRRQILAFKQYFANLGATVLLIDDRSRLELNPHLQSIAHGIVSLDRSIPVYGPMRRRIAILKMRGSMFREGFHDYVIRPGGLIVYPRLVAAEHRALYPRELVSSGVAYLDQLLGGGLGRGTSTLITGAAGTGKSSVSTQYAQAAAERGEHPALFLFDELTETFLARSAGLGIDVRTHIDSGAMTIQQVDPAQLSPGSFARLVRDAVEGQNARVVVIDSLNGLLNAMPSENLLIVHLHELLSYLGQLGVTTILILAQRGIVATDSPVDTSYLADTVLAIRFFETHGAVRQAISVIKKRTGNHERTIRELKLTSHGIVVGEPIHDVQGILTGDSLPVRKLVDP